LSRFSASWRALGTLLLLLVLGPRFAVASQAQAPARADPGQHAAADLTTPVVPVRSPLIKGEVVTPHFRIAYTARSEGAARALATRIENVRESFRRTLGRDWPGTTEIRLGLGREEYVALALGAPPPPWAVALAYPGHNVLLFEAASLTNEDGFSILTHELSHAALGQLGKGWPHWFQEGLAMRLAGERFAIHQYTTMFAAIQQERIRPFSDLRDGWPSHPTDAQIAYAQSLSFVDFLVENEKGGPEKLGALLDDMRKGDPFETAFARAFGVSMDLHEQDWRGELKLRYAWLPFSVANSLMWIGSAGLCVAAFVVRRARKAKRLEELAAEDAAEDEALRLEAEAKAQAQALAFDPYTYGAPDDRSHPPGFSDEPETIEDPKGTPKPTIH